MVIRDDDYVRWIEAVRDAARHNLPLPEIPTGETDHSPADPEFVALMNTIAARGKLFSACKAAVLDSCAVFEEKTGKLRLDQTEELEALKRALRETADRIVEMALEKAAIK